MKKITSIVWTLAVLLSLAPAVWAQTGEITGTVTDSTTGNPLPGVNVAVVGTQLGTATDANGQYTISGVEPGTHTVRASFVGYQANTVEGIEVSAGETTTADIVLQPSTVALEDVVVTALGVEREERSLTYGTEEVNTATIAETRELNPVNSLEGKVAGLSLSSSGTGLGSSARVLLRGNRSFSGSSQPLYVVDGVPIQGSPNNLNPNIIENINVLKGPNAAALYGSEAQNGAIVITTRSANEDGVSVSFSSNFMFRDPMLLRDYQNQYGQGSGGEYSPNSEYSWGPAFDGDMVQYWSPDPSTEGQEVPYTAQPDNVSDVFQTGRNASINLTAGVGGEIGGRQVQTLFSYAYTDATGVVPENALQRHNVMVRMNSDLSDNLSLDGKLSYMQETLDNQLNTGESFANPIRHAYRLPRNIRTEDAENFSYIAPSGLQRQNFWNPGSNGGANPYWTINRNLSLNEGRQIRALGALTYEFTDALSLRVRGAYDGGSGEGETRWYNDTYIIADNGEYAISKYSSWLLNGDALLSYTRDIGEDWYFDANVGGSLRRERNSGLSANTGRALTVPNFFTISNTQNPIVTENIGSPQDKQSIYAFAQIGWRDALYLDITGRNDWSSTLPADSRSYFYPSVGLSAILSDLVPLPDAISFAKVRGSWAKVGNSAAPFQLSRTATLSPGGNNGYLQLSSVIPNDDLLPEQTVSRELGLALRFFEGRLGIESTVYRTNTRNQLFTVALPVGSGASSFFTNGGNIENEGVEVSLDGTPVQTSNFTWEINGNFSANRNTVVEISDDRPILSIGGGSFLGQNRLVEGEPFGQFYSRGFVRDDQGRVIVGEDGVPQITDGETVPIADYNPDWQGGFGSTFTYGNFDFSFLISHRQGGTIASFTNAILYADGSAEETLAGRDGEGIVFGEDVFSDETAVTEDGSPNDIVADPETFWRNLGGRNSPIGEAFVESATNTRLREVVLGYNLTSEALGSMFGGVPINGLRLSLVGKNLFFLYRKSDTLDPNILTGTGANDEGFNAFAPPTSREYGVNLRISF